MLTGNRGFSFILIFVDAFSRKSVGIHVGLNCRQGDLYFVLMRITEREKVHVKQELIIRSDNGPQMRSNKFHNNLKKLEAKLSHKFIPVQILSKNAHVESFFSIVESVFVQGRYFHSFADAYVRTHK